MNMASRIITPISIDISRIRPWHVVLLFCLVYVAITLAGHNGDPQVFVEQGERYDPAKTNQSLGYDGQFYFQMAKDPLNAWQLVDVPAYRYQRILYPILARILSLGQTAWIPWALILINLIAISLGTYLMESTLVYQRANRWYALVYGLFIGMLVSLRLDLAEPLAFLMVQAAILAWLRGQVWQSAVWFSLASLTRETTLLFAAGVALYLIFQKKFLRAGLWSFCVGLPFVVWHLVLKTWLGSWGVGSGGALATSFEIIPFHGWWGIAQTDLSTFLILSALVFPMAILPAILSLVNSGLALLRKVTTPAVWALFLNAAAFAFLPRSNIYEPLGLSRVTLGLVVAVLNYGAVKPSKRTLKYACLWLITLVFVYRDSFLPFH
jgi:hypothetical protein